MTNHLVTDAANIHKITTKPVSNTRKHLSCYPGQPFFKKKLKESTKNKYKTNGRDTKKTIPKEKKKSK